VNSQSISYRALALIVRAALVVALAGMAWTVYLNLPSRGGFVETTAGQTSVKIILSRSADLRSPALDIPIELSPIDLVATTHEYKLEPRPGHPFSEFMRERMKGRTELKTRLDAEGRASIMVPPGDWWLHALLSGEEDLEWRLHITVSGPQQTIELTTNNTYTRSKSF
jgi:hypothetical protein